jgi:hypothetical protein
LSIDTYVIESLESCDFDKASVGKLGCVLRKKRSVVQESLDAGELFALRE